MTNHQSTLQNYQQLLLNEPLKSVEFLVQTMGFEPISANHEREIFIKDRLGNYFKLPLNAAADSREPMLIYTDDCLSDYFELKTSGVHFITEPQYTPRGLMAEFTDKWGNYYKMLEERFYEDNQ